MAESATRNILFDMRVIVDPESRSLVMSFARSVKEAQDSLTRFQQNAAGASLDFQRNLNDSLATVIRQRDRLMTQAQEADRIRSQAALSQAVNDIDARVRAEQEAANRINAARQQAAQEPTREVRDWQESPVEQAREEANHLGLIRQQTTQDERAAYGQRGAAVRTYAEVTAQATRNAETLTAQVRNAKREMFATLAEMSGSVMQVARGFVAMGLAGEKDLEKVMRGLMQVQSAFDLVSGGTRIMLGLGKSMHLYRQATEAATAAQNAFNVAQGTGAAIGQGSLLTSLGGVAAGMNARVNALVAGKAAMAAQERAAEVAALRQAAMLGGSGAAGVAAPAAATKVLGFGGSTLGGAAVSGGVVAGVAAAALASVTFAIRSAIDAAVQASKHGVGGGATPGSFTERWGSWNMNPFNHIDAAALVTGGTVRTGNIEARAAAAKSTEATDRYGKKSEKFQAEVGVDYARLDEHTQALAQAMAQARQSSDALFNNEMEGLKATEKRDRIVARLGETEKATQRLRSEAAALDIQWASEKSAKEAEAQVSRSAEVALLRDRISIERQVGEEAKAAAEEAKAAAREKLATENLTLQKIESQLQLEKDRSKSAKERFALMNEGEQQNVLQLAKRLQGGQRLAAEELGKLSSFRDLAGVKEGFDKELDRRASAGGFDKLGGAQEAAIAELEKKVKAQKDVVATIETQVNVTIEADVKKITDELTKKVGEKLKAIEDELTASVKRLGGEVTDIKQRIQNRANGGL